MTLLLDRPDLVAALTRPSRSRDTHPITRPNPIRGRVTHPHLPGLDLVGAGTTVPLAGGGVAEYANLDHAASAPALAGVRDAVDAVLARYASVHRGAGFHSRVCTDLYEGARVPVRRFVGGRPDDAVIFTRNTTDSLNLLAHCLPARTTVVVFDSEHHAALLAWRDHRVVRLPVPTSTAEAIALADAALRRRQPGPALLVVTGASNVTGECWPVAELAALARSRGARIALDAAQLAPHRRVDISALGVDYVALSGHKLYAPYGAGALVGRADWLESATPYLVGGGATASVTDTETVYKPVPDRHEAGSPNVPGAVALATACHLLATADREALAATEFALAERLRVALADIPGVTVHSLFGAEVESVGTVTFTIAGQPANVVAAALSAEYGIGVRDGAFCAHPLVRHLLGAAGCDVADGTGAALRASLGLGTTDEHIDRLIAAVQSIAARGPRLRYVIRDGRPVPARDDRVTPALVPWLAGG